MKPTLIHATIVAAIGGLIFGFDTAVISGTTHWFMAAIISWTFPDIAEISGGHTFLYA